MPYIKLEDDSKLPAAQIDPSKPREEHHYRDIYPDLDKNIPLSVFIDHEESTIETSRLKPSILSNLNKPHFTQISKDILPIDNTKIPQKLIKLGYKSKTTNDGNGSTTYIRDLDGIFSKEKTIVEQISSNQMMFKSMYDMDEQDNYFVKYLQDNDHNNFNNELLEISMTILENEWHHLEQKIPPKLRSKVKTTHATHLYELYGSDDGIGVSQSIDDQNCAICDNSECDNSNAIIYCDGCDIAVHQDCYGVLFIPEGQWLCRKCMINKHKKLKCQFCPSVTGAFKQTANGQWAHALCALWIPELYFASATHMEPIEGFEMIPKGRWNLNCYICKQKTGACIQCANKNCVTAFHTTCAKRAGLLMEYTKGIQGAVLDQSSMKCFCHRHSPRDSASLIKERIEKTRKYFDYMSNKHLRHFSVTKPKKKAGIFSSNNADNKRWKTSRGTPLAPNYFIKIIEKLLEKFKVEKGAELAVLLTRYWSMKREVKRGAPLIRRVNELIINGGGGDPKELPDKLNFVKVLLSDLNKLEQLSDSVLNREKVKLQEFNSLIEIIDMSHFPQNFWIKGILEKILKIGSSIYLMDIDLKDSLNLKEIINKFKNHEYIKIDGFLDDLNTLLKELEKRNDPTEIKLRGRILREIEEDFNKLKHFDVVEDLTRDFVINGLRIEEVKYRGRLAMEDVSLSDIEE